jgi:hypothetical protein
MTPQAKPQRNIIRRAGVFGWLGVLVFAMLVLWPLLVMIGIRNLLLAAALDFPQLQERYIWYYFRTAVLFVVVGSALISMIGGGMLLRRRTRSTVYWAIAALWVSGPLGHIIALSLPSLMYGYGDALSNIFRHSDTLITSMAIRAGCTAYLLFSRRVKRTYPKKGEPPPQETDDDD